MKFFKFDKLDLSSSTNYNFVVYSGLEEKTQDRNLQMATLLPNVKQKSQKGNAGARQTHATFSTGL